MSDRRWWSRRQLLGAVGGGLTVGVAGCLGGTSGPRYERRAVDPPADAEPRTTAEQSLAAQLATTETNRAAAPIDSLALTGHEFVVESGYRGATVQGTVHNRAGSRVDLAEVRVRVYDGADRLRGLYTDSVGALDGGERWRFTVIVLTSLSSIDAYDIAAVGTPA